MRHRIYGKKLGRNSNERSGLFRSLVQSIFIYGTITTSQTKASAIKGMVDKIITLAKNKDSQRLLQSFFTDKLLQERLIKEIAPKMQNRISGYTSMVKVGVREGDRTTLVKMSLIGLEDLKPLTIQSLRDQRQLAKQSSNSKRKIATPRHGGAQGKLPRNDKKRVSKKTAPTGTVTKRKATAKK